MSNQLEAAPCRFPVEGLIVEGPERKGRGRMNEPKRAGSDEDALRLVVEGTASETGTEFFRALVKNLAAAMDTAGA